MIPKSALPPCFAGPLHGARKTGRAAALKRTLPRPAPARDRISKGNEGDPGRFRWQNASIAQPRLAGRDHRGLRSAGRIALAPCRRSRPGLHRPHDPSQRPGPEMHRCVNPIRFTHLSASWGQPSPLLREAGWPGGPDGAWKAGLVRWRFAVKVAQTDLGRSGGPHPIRRCAPPPGLRPGAGSSPARLEKGWKRLDLRCVNIVRVDLRKSKCLAPEQPKAGAVPDQTERTPRLTLIGNRSKARRSRSCSRLR